MKEFFDFIMNLLEEIKELVLGIIEGANKGE